MRAIALLVALTSGCATTWIATQATGTERAWDEGIREVTVPAPGVHERINIGLPLTGAAAPFALTCTTTQRATDTVYHSAFRYGKRWKIMTGLMVLAEAAVAGAFLVGAKEKPENYLAVGYFGLDAAVTAALFFVPRKEIYRKEDKPVVTPVRSDCPDGMVLSIGADRFPVDAAGRIGDVAEAALDAWMAEPMGPLQLEVAGQIGRVEIGQSEQCVWLRSHRGTQCYSAAVLTNVLTSFEVPVGTLSTVAARDAQPM